jgi:serine/threonine-protein kinase
MGPRAMVRICPEMEHGDQGNLRGQVLGGKYLVGDMIGAGGMGVVYEATHVELKTPCALKVVASGRDDPAYGKRLLREARVLATLSGPHAVRVLDAGRLSDASPYVVMERLRGEPLSELLKRRRSLPLDRALNFAWQICEAVKEAHAHGIIHRDIKPSNVFVVNDTSIKVLDFGLALRLDRASHDSTMTTSEFAGSPAYMSPEQIRGRSEIDQRSDIWSIGVVLFEMVTGRLPFDGANKGALLAAVVADPEARLRQYVPECPPELDRLTADCLEKNPADRPRNVPELQTRIEVLLANGRLPDSHAIRPGMESVSAVSVSTLTGSPSFARRLKRGRSVRLGAVLLVALALSLVATWVARGGGSRAEADDQKPETGLAKRPPEANEPRSALVPAPRARSESRFDLAPAALQAPATEPEPPAASTDPRPPRQNAERARESPVSTPDASPSAVLRTIETRH